VRGAYWKMINIEKNNSKKVIAASAGNHAQGTAYAASKLKIPCTIVMPENASTAKVAATSGYGASIILAGANYDESYEHAKILAKETNATMLHPFDDPCIIAGQGTIGLELKQDLKDVNTVIVPIGGGGLAAGIAVALKEKNPRIKIIGVEAVNMPSMKKSISEKKITSIPSKSTIADGLDVKTPGEHTFEIVQKYIDDIVTVTDVEIAEAMFHLLERSKIVAEPAGAAATAAILTGKLNLEKRNVVSIVSGGNVDMPLMNKLITRGLISSGRIVRMVFGLRDRPGALKEILNELTARNVNILDVQVDRFYRKIGLGPVEVLVSMETKSSEHTKEMIKNLKKKDFTFRIIE